MNIKTNIPQYFVLPLRQFSKLFLSLPVRQIGPNQRLKIIQVLPFFDRPVLGHNDCTDLPLNPTACPAHFLSISPFTIQMLANGGLADSQELGGGILRTVEFKEAQDHDFILWGGQVPGQYPHEKGPEF
jgi:hypothetical protein